MSEYIAVQGCTLKKSDSSVLTNFTVDSINITTQLVGDGKVKAGGKEAYIQKIDYNVAWSCNDSSASPAKGTYSGSITGTSAKAKSTQKSFILETDTGKAVLGPSANSAIPATYPSETITVEIDDVGQDKVKVS